MHCQTKGQKAKVTPKIHGKEIWRKKWKQQALNTTGRR